MTVRVPAADLAEANVRPLVARAKAGDPEAAAELMRVMRPTIRSLLIIRGYTADQQNDQEAAGRLGLWEAVQRYDPNHPVGKDFRLVAWYRIRHEMEEWRARNTGAVPMPRSAWRQARTGTTDHRVTRAASTPYPLEDTDQTVEAAEDTALSDLDDREMLVFYDSLDLLDKSEWWSAAVQFCEDQELPPAVADRLVETKQSGLF